jgi:hypothetical protein
VVGDGGAEAGVFRVVVSMASVEAKSERTVWQTAAAARWTRQPHSRGDRLQATHLVAVILTPATAPVHGSDPGLNCTMSVEMSPACSRTDCVVTLEQTTTICSGLAPVRASW